MPFRNQVKMTCVFHTKEHCAEMINRKEESELRKRRVDNKKAREQRRKDLDSVWE